MSEFECCPGCIEPNNSYSVYRCLNEDCNYEGCFKYMPFSANEGCWPESECPECGCTDYEDIGTIEIDLSTFGDEVYDECPNCNEENHGFYVYRCLELKCGHEGCYDHNYIGSNDGCWSDSDCPECGSSNNYVKLGYIKEEDD